MMLHISRLCELRKFQTRKVSSLNRSKIRLNQVYCLVKSSSLSEARAAADIPVVIYLPCTLSLNSLQPYWYFIFAVLCLWTALKVLCLRCTLYYDSPRGTLSSLYSIFKQPYMYSIFVELLGSLASPTGT